MGNQTHVMNEMLLLSSWISLKSAWVQEPRWARGLGEERRGAATAGISSTAPRPPGQETQKEAKEELRESVC